MPSSQQQYTGFEQGPIRPPSEASSLLIRVTRNCPWNHCTFCPVYKGTKFSLRPVDHIIRDIDQVKNNIQKIQTVCTGSFIDRNNIQTIWDQTSPDQAESLHAAISWFSNGMRSVFIQDANSLIIKPENMIKILSHLRECFPEIQRVTSYARSHTIARISQDNLEKICDAGLNRIHIGLESGSDEVLKIMKKGVTKKDHINAGKKVKNAGMELSEYVMPGLGGQEFSKIHALETADALNQINPEFIRLRSLAIPSNIPLFEMAQKKLFVACTDKTVAKEIQLMISNLKDIQSVITSDHILNLFEDVHGKLPDDKNKMLSIIDHFLNLSPLDQTIFQIGRRLGIFRFLSQLKEHSLREQVQKICTQMNITPDNVDQNIQKVIQRFI